ncbi:hypothetical protein SBA4_2540002 [Candidatus Sulfopaludibacter sp. SbA4]|nr:hypothetical protein SBA4_2540002 [Candidatus Sulfopaludibacter sp. SbA4]
MTRLFHKTLKMRHKISTPLRNPQKKSALKRHE